MKSIIATLAAATGFASLVNAQVAQSCQGSNSDLCYSLNIPEATSSSGTGDIYFQIQAPTSYQWVGLGQGSGMRGANMFVIYASDDGNVTLSPRLGVGYVMPLYNSAAEVELLGGTGIANGMMTANVRCSSCNSWSGGEMNFQSSSASWIYAALSGEPLDSNDPSARISFHSDYSPFEWDFSQAKGGSSVNPFVATVDGTTSTPSTSSTPTTPTTHTTGKKKGSFERTKMLIVAHGFCAALAWVIIFPSGGILIRLFSFRGVVYAHAGVQLVGWVIFITGFGLGLYNAIHLDLVSKRHAILGLVVFSLFVLQPLFGLLHHLRFRKTAARGVFSVVHIWIGRVAILLGMINGGLGLADSRIWHRNWAIAYGVLAGVFGLTYVASIVFGETQRAKKIAALARSKDAADSDRDASLVSESNIKG